MNFLFSGILETQHKFFMMFGLCISKCPEISEYNVLILYIIKFIIDYLNFFMLN